MKSPFQFLQVLTIAAAMVSSAQAQTFLTNGLVAYYPFHGNADDASGNGNNGVVHGATLTTNRFGVPDSAYAFDGIQDWIQVPETLYGPTNSAVTISVWVTTDNGGYSGTVQIFEKSSSNGETDMKIAANQFVFQADLSTHSWVRATTPMSANRLTHLVGVYQQGEGVWLYTNGVLAGSITGIPDETLYVEPEYPLSSAFGIYDQAAGPYQAFQGVLEDIRVYTQALSASEVQQLYQYESAPRIKITQDLTNIYAIYGQNTNLSVSATGGNLISYQWYFVPTNNGGQAGAYAETINGFVYGAVVTNGGFGYGNIPNVSFVGGGGSGAAGYGTVSNGVLIGITVTNAGEGYASLPSVVIDPPDGELFGQTNSTLIVSNAEPANLGNYFVVISSSGGSVTSSVVNLTLLYLPFITVQPTNQTIPVGGTAGFSVTAGGSSPLAYQWLFGGVGIAGATNATWSVDNVAATNAGSYSVVVTDPFGSVISSIAVLSVSNVVFTTIARANVQTVSIAGSGVPGSSYILQTATNLSGPWWSLTTNTANAATGAFNFTDPGATNASRFYRLLGQP